MKQDLSLKFLNLFQFYFFPSDLSSFAFLNRQLTIFDIQTLKTKNDIPFYDRFIHETFMFGKSIISMHNQKIFKYFGERIF